MTPISSLDMAVEPGLHHSSSSPTQSEQDRPERSRNAKAQARHRAKRKAYIEQLEQTVIRLQNALAASPDQVSSLPPPLMRIRELEQENNQLSRELEELRRQLEARNARLRPDIDHRHHHLPAYDDRQFDREAKRRRAMQSSNGPYMQLTNTQLPSPPLSAAPSLSPYSHQSSTSTMGHQRSPSASMTPSYNLAYHMPETPSSSSTASSPSTTSFSPTDAYSTFSSDRSQLSGGPANGSYGQNSCQYNVVKVEEDSYTDSHHIPQSNGYSTSLSAFGAAQTALSQWHTYPERA